MERGERGGGGVAVALRYDDFSNGSPDDLDAFLFESVAQAGLALTVAAIPLGPGPEESAGARAGEGQGPLESRKADLLAPYLGASLELAQHGYDHRPVGRDPLGRPAEFSGQAAGEQAERIASGLHILERAVGRRPRTFVPPWNRFDAATCAALEELGFETLSAGRDALDVIGSRLRFAPATTPLGDLRREVEEAEGRPALTTLVVLLHPYDFRELGTRWGRVDRDEWVALLDWLAERPEVAVRTVGDLAAMDPDLGPERLASFARLSSSPSRRLVPPRASGGWDRPLARYPRRRESGRLARRRWARGLALMGGLAVGSLAVGWLLADLATALSPAGRGGVRAALTLTSLILLVRWRRPDGPYFRGIALTVAACSAAVGAWVS